MVLIRHLYELPSLRRTAEEVSLNIADHSTNQDDYREYRSDPRICVNCPTRHRYTHSKDYIQTVQRYIWRDYEDLADNVRYTSETRLMLDAYPGFSTD